MRPAWVFDGSGHSVTHEAFWHWLTSLDDGVAIDTETAGVGWSDAVRLVQFADAAGGYAIDPAHPEGKQLVLDALAAVRGTITFHNAGFDISALARLGYDPYELWARAVDTYVMGHVDSPSNSEWLRLEVLAKRELGADSGDWKKDFRAQKRERGWDWATVPRLVLVPYGVSDAVNTARLRRVYEARETAVERDIVRVEMRVARLTWEVERHGMRLDPTYAKMLHKRWTADRAADLEWFATVPLEDATCGKCKGTGTTPAGKRECSTCGGERILRNRLMDNPNADAQIASALIRQGWKPRTLTPKSGKPKLDSDILEALADKYEVAYRLIEYKRKGKWLSAYVQSCLSAADERGYVHASYNSLGARTSRMSCSSPPLQQLPKGGGGEIRRLFIASPGNVIASADYNAMEFRLAGAFSGDRRIIDVYEAGGDWYAQVANDLGITRPEAKVFVLAIMYGARARRIAAALSIPFRKAQGLVSGFWESYADLARWNDEQTAMAERGDPPRSYWGRTLSPHAPYAAGNAVIQGSAAEAMKEGLMRLEDADLLHYVCAIVHDEVVLDVPRADAEKVTAEVAATLSDLSTFACPLVAEGKVYGRSWGDGYA